MISKLIQPIACALMLAASANASAFFFQNTVIAEGDIIHHFYQKYSGAIAGVDLVERKGRQIYNIAVEEQSGDAWLYSYDASTGKLLHKRSNLTKPNLAFHE